jgi:probable 2-oxoglutarate dehydrogenase E1 component DHKTD1
LVGKSPEDEVIAEDEITTCTVDGVLHGLTADSPTLSDVKKHLRSSYCGAITLESAHVQDEEEREWIVRRFEEELSSEITRKRQLEVLQHLIKFQTFETFMAKKFQHVKRYGGEGAESLVVFVEEVLRQFRQGVSGECTAVIGMPHRGRLSLMTGLLGYSPEAMFYKIKGHCEHPTGLPTTGDVLTHLHTSYDVPMETEGQGTVHVSLLPNPSHLEAINPVAMGNTRGRLKDPDNTLCLQIHGDAAFSGQGIVAESFSLSNVPGYSVGGSLHLIVNNQIGFTTPPALGRSSPYCSDVGKMIGCPIIHVNAAAPEDVLKASRVAIDYKKKYRKDIIVDLVCFRKWGHNELDDPSMTQPIMYRAINSRASIPNEYAAILKEEELADHTHAGYNEYLNECFKKADNYEPKDTQLRGKWLGLSWPGHQLTSWNTGCSPDMLRYVGGRSCEGRGNVHPKIAKIFQDRLKKVETGQSIDWATAEAMALGSLLMSGTNVRLSGQDVGRGTFGHRHFALVDQEDEHIDTPLSRLSPTQGLLEVVNSPLIEEAVLGYEYGVSVSDANWLVIWEAQFGDFFNGAQVIVDTFLSSGEEKWLLQSGLVMLLPHGYDGAGPEHSSSRIERFLQLTNSSETSPDGDDINFQVVHPTTPAQYFHLLRAQIVRNFRKPLVVASPKILLRLPAAVSSLQDMVTGTTFQHVLPDPHVSSPSEVKKVVFCSGKHFYFLDSYRKEKGINDVAIVRLESLAPFPTAYLHQELTKYSNATTHIWSQEEHRNMGPWTFVDARFRNQLGIQLTYAGRGPGGPPAVGTSLIHQEQVAKLLEDTFQ